MHAPAASLLLLRCVRAAAAFDRRDVCSAPTHNGTAFNQDDLNHTFTATWQDCCANCVALPGCKAYTWGHRGAGGLINCYLKSAPNQPHMDPGSVSSVVGPPPPPATPAPPPPPATPAPPQAPDNGTPMSLQACNRSKPTQMWAYDATQLHSLYLSAFGREKCLDCAGCGYGAQPHIWNCLSAAQSPGVGYPAQAWNLTADRRVVSIAKGMCLRRVDKVELQMADCVKGDVDYQFELDSATGLLRSLAGSDLCIEVKFTPYPAVSCALPQYRANAWCDATKSPTARTALLLKEMTDEEKDELLHGTGMNPYVGNTGLNMRLGIPALTLNDGPQGFRGKAGTSTQWMCSLSVGASWDPDVAFQWGRAMGEEFAAKGANVQLGPGGNVERVPVNGRNFEYISGEDPLLGYVLIGEAVKGIQGAGVMANAKHYINNNQETDRGTNSAEVDERTRMEIYAEPFRGAVDAGVLSIMCSYNKINGDHACENDQTLNKELKGYMGFKYFVMSDWGATHNGSKAANAGLDQSQPGGPFDGDLVKGVQSGQISRAVFDDKARRVLLAMFTVGIFDRQANGSLDADVTSAAHNDLARTLAERATVLLQNRGGLLPLDPAKLRSVAVFGAPAHDRVVTGGGGSGGVTPKYTVSPLSGLRNALSARGASHVNVTYYAGGDPAVAAERARAADVALTVLATSSGEGTDRASLDLPGDQVQLADAVGRAAPSSSVALVISPGAALLPFAARTAAVLMMFLPGQEEGNAFARVVLGDVAPSARLPLSIPHANNEVGLTPQQYPGVDLRSEYSEKLEVGYRWYHARGVEPHFPFGHGLSYTTFDFSALRVAGRAVTLDVANNGTRDGADVVQLYLDYPAAAGEPPRQLRGFEKVSLAAGERRSVRFDVSDKALSVWDVAAHAYKLVPGSFHVAVGASSQDIRLTGTLTAE